MPPSAPSVPSRDHPGASIAGTRVLVTGAGGVIGSHLVERLVTRGARVRAFVKYNGRGDPGALADLPSTVRDSVEVVMGDIGDPISVDRAVHGCDCVFHLAALIGIPYSYLAPYDYVRVNVEGTLNGLRACLAASTPRVVHTSTSEVYGTARYVPIDETHPLQGQSPYSASKIAADKMAEAYHLSFGLPVTTVRPFNTFGPRQSARAFVPSVISQALSRDRVTMGALEPVRDLTFVEDTVEGFIAAATHDAAVGLVLNLGSGEGHRVGVIAETILRLAGKANLSIEQDAARVRPAGSEVMRLISDNRLARDVCGWRPGISLEDGLTRTIDWVTRHLERYHPNTYMV